jgi:hypothetical protein
VKAPARPTNAPKIGLKKPSTAAKPAAAKQSEEAPGIGDLTGDLEEDPIAQSL